MLALLSLFAFLKMNSELFNAFNSLTTSLISSILFFLSYNYSKSCVSVHFLVSWSAHAIHDLIFFIWLIQKFTFPALTWACVPIPCTELLVRHLHLHITCLGVETDGFSALFHVPPGCPAFLLLVTQFSWFEA